jgi:hypothetical protein
VVVTGPAPGVAARAAVDGVLADLRDHGHRGIVVDSPPGAGKTTLVVRAAADLAGTGAPVIIIAQTNEQVDDLVYRLATADPTLPIGRLSSARYEPSVRVARHPTVSVRSRISDLRSARVTIGTAAKWATVTEGTWPWAIVDEAYQMRSDALLRVAGRFERALFVGDPGQLDPFSTVDGDRWAGLTWDPMQSAVAVLLRHNPDLPVHRLPVSWRLPPSAAGPVAAAFYPFASFTAGTRADDRRIELRSAAAGGPADAAVEQAARTGWALYQLPPRYTPRTDAEAAGACVELATRLLARGAVATSESTPHGTPVTAGRIAIGAAHRDQVAAIRSLLPAAASAVTVDTANRLQGREFDVTVVLHPLSGRRDATAFHLETGRLCVLTSRHRHACLVVARAGIPELLDDHPPTDRVQLNVPVRFPDGWEANQSVLAHLTGHLVRA